MNEIATVRFRIAQERDFAGLAAAAGGWRDDDQRLRVEQAVLELRCWAAVADHEPGEVLGYGLLRHDWFGHPLIELVLVHPAHRDRGIGRALVRHLIGAASGSERRIFATTNQSNAPMQHLLESEDFVRSGVIHNLDEGDPELVYARHPAPPRG